MRSWGRARSSKKLLTKAYPVASLSSWAFREYVLVIATTDAICAPCPNRQGDLCGAQAKIDELDAKHAAVLHILPGMQLTWGEAKARILKHMTLQAFHQACALCSWKSLNLCEAALTDFLARG